MHHRGRRGGDGRAARGGLRAPGAPPVPVPAARGRGAGRGGQHQRRAGSTAGARRGPASPCPAAAPRRAGRRGPCRAGRRAGGRWGPWRWRLRRAGPVPVLVSLPSALPGAGERAELGRASAAGQAGPGPPRSLPSSLPGGPGGCRPLRLTAVCGAPPRGAAWDTVALHLQ